MAHYSALVLLLPFLAGAAAVAGAAAAVPGGGCEVSALAAEVAASCAAGAATRPCCDPVLGSVELGGGACLCRVAAEMPILHAGLNGSALLALYASCGGGGATPLLAACHGAPPAGGSLVAALPSAATGARVAGVVKDDCIKGATPPESSSCAGGQFSAPPPPVVIEVTRPLDSGDRRLLVAFAVMQFIGLFGTLILAAAEVYRCIYGGKKP